MGKDLLSSLGTISESMALIAICCYDTVENGRTEYTAKALESLYEQYRFSDKHRILIVDNASCQATKDVLSLYSDRFTIITNSENVGTAKAINQAWKLRKEGEHLIKMDNDCVVNYQGDWVGEMERAIERDPTIGIIGLKRKDCIEKPSRTDFYKSELQMLPQKAGEPWVVVEKVNHVMGTCCMFNSALVDKIGGLYQMDGIYGFDDSLAAIRCQLAGFYNCFLPHIDIDHIDRGDTEYQKEKERYALSMMDQYNHTKIQMQQGKQSIIFPL